jgi:hypothetical protein
MSGRSCGRFHLIATLAAQRPTLAARFQQINRKVLDRLRALFAAGMVSGEIREDVDIDAETALLIATLRGIAVQWLIGLVTFDPEAICSVLIASLRAGLGRWARCEEIAWSFRRFR